MRTAPQANILDAHIDDPGFWRCRADELRSRADDLLPPESEALLVKAAAYEKRASRIEARIRERRNQGRVRR